MPTYQYSCTECGHFFEQVQSFSEDSLTTCPECEGRLRKVFNAVGVVFKGSGFYRNDSRAPAGEKGDGGSGTSGGETTEKTSPAKADGGSGATSDAGKSTSAGSTPATSGSSTSAA